MIKKIIASSIAVVLTALSGACVAHAFAGPGGLSAGVGGGQLQIDASGNIGFGTAAPTPSGSAGEANFGRVFTIASSSDPGISLKNLSGGGHSYTLYSRANGRLAIWDDTANAVRLLIEPTGRVAIGATTTLGSALASTLQVFGNISATNGISGDVYPSSIIGGAFQSANYAFPSQLAVGTTTIGVLPAQLYVDGSAAVAMSGSTRLGVGTSTPSTAKLVIVPGTQPAIDVGSQRIINLASPTSNNDAANKTYVDTAVAAASSSNVWARSGSNIYSTNSGSVGIGTTTAPTYQLQVSGTFGAAGGTAYIDSLGNIFGTSFYDSANPVYFLDPSAATSMKTAGSVNIGASGVPAGRLDIVGGYASGAISGSNGLSFAAGGLSPDRAQIWWGDNTGWKLHFGTRDGAGSFQPRVTFVDTGGVGIGTVNPGANLLYVNGAALVNGTLNMNNNNIGSVGKITVTTIDPLYEINGKKYSTFASSIAGGVKEEFVGRGTLAAQDNQYVLDLAAAPAGSDLWVWYHAVDFSNDNVEVLATPRSAHADLWYEVKGDKVVFHGNAPADFSYRLIGRRHDWREWPTLAKDQHEKASFVLEDKRDSK